MASFYSNEGDHHILPNEYFLNQKLSYHFEPESMAPDQINRHLDFTPDTNHQGLSLSLGSQDPSLVHFHSDFNQYMQYSNPTATLSNSKYLKAAQDLLDELVSVHRVSIRVQDSNSVSSELQEPSNNNHELQDKMTKLVSMLDEVDRRYRQYRYQMQVLSSSFDSIAGPGASPPYTSLALRTISRQFRSLRDAIKKQIFSVQKGLGGDLNVSLHGRLRYVDHHLGKKNLTLKQTIQPWLPEMRQAWRPQRGLPEKAVSVLRAWLFEHFLHPYPKDSEKVILARETGLTRSQVANWFINARVRLWKPMIEEMYKEEFGYADTKLESSNEYTRGNQVTLVLGLQRSENDPRPVGDGGIQPSGNEYFYMDTSNNNQNRFDSTNLLCE